VPPATVKEGSGVAAPEGVLRTEAREAPTSGILEVFNYARGRRDIIPLYVGEGDVPTPPFIRAAAEASLAAGETFYTAQRGLPALRDALAEYHHGLYQRSFDRERFFVTSGGMHAIQIACRMVAGSGDEVLVPAPAWPNVGATVGLTGAKAVLVPMTFGNAGWTLDLDRLAGAITGRTRAIFVNSPANPTGWTATLAELAALADLARRRGLWLIADEVYQRFFYAGDRAPSLYDLGEPDERTLLVNTFSKNWAMTGWRIGWLSAAPSLGPVIENLIQYSSSGTPAFTQRAATVALDQGEEFLAHQVDRARRGRAVVCEGLRASARVRFAEPDGGFYVFFAIDGENDTRALALRLIDEAGVGLAPGAAFGDAGANYLRLCFARDEATLEKAVNRLADWLKR
jgi:aspartate/methionine/tyrosine aminotransferase